MSESKTSPITLDEFPIPSYADWRAEAESNLKGAPFDKKLITKTFEGIDIQPIYRKEDLEGLTHLGSLPGEAPYVRGTHADSNAWEIAKCPCAPGADPLMKLVTGTLEGTLKVAFDELAKADAIAVNSRIYHNAGGNAVQELAFALATGVEYLRQAEQRGVSIARIALAWILAQQPVSSVIIGARTLEQLKDNLGAAEVVLSVEELETLDHVSLLPEEYPGWMLAMQNQDRRPGTVRDWARFAPPAAE